MNSIRPELLALLIPILSIFLAGAVLLTAVVLKYLQRRRLIQALQQERLAAIDKGVPLPPLPEALFYNAAAPSTPARILLKGLIWLFVGLGFMAALYQENRREYLFTLVPIGIGLAYLICYFAEARQSEQPASPPAPPAPPELPLPAKA